EIKLDATQSHHARDVLRLSDGAVVELFDNAGAVARGQIVAVDPHVVVRVESIANGVDPSLEIVVASAVPKGERADWMIEKLSELGVSKFTPLATARSVVHPRGTGKMQRWRRIAVESAKQSRRAGVMRIDELMDLSDALERLSQGLKARA